jgi:MAPEG family
MGLRNEQRDVLLGMLAAMLGSAGFLYLGHRFLPPFVPVLMDPLDRVLYTLRWLVLPTSMLVLGVARMAAGRFFSRHAIDGSAPIQGDGLDIDQRYLVNTAEQLLLYAVAHLALALHLDGTSVRLVPVFALWFAFARGAFWYGYHRHPLTRSFGFGATFYPTVAVILYDLAHIVG